MGIGDGSDFPLFYLDVTNFNNILKNNMVQLTVLFFSNLFISLSFQFLIN